MLVQLFSSKNALGPRQLVGRICCCSESAVPEWADRPYALSESFRNEMLLIRSLWYVILFGVRQRRLEIVLRNLSLCRWDPCAGADAVVGCAGDSSCHRIIESF